MTDPIDTPPDDKEKARSSNYGDILGKPAFFKNEDPEEYFQLEQCLRDEMDPKNIFEEMELRDLTNKCWEERRLRRIQVALVESNFLQSLIQLLAPRYGENHEQAAQDAQDYYSGDPNKMRRVEKMLAAMGITAEHIEANAMHLHSSPVHTLDSMISSRETGRKSIIRERQRRRRKAEKSLRSKQASNAHSMAHDAPDQSKRPRLLGRARDEQ